MRGTEERACAFPLSRREKRNKRRRRRNGEKKEKEEKGRRRPFSAAIERFPPFFFSTSTSTSTTTSSSPFRHNKKPKTQLAPEDELNWDDGTANSEYCVDRWDDVGKYQALKWLLGGLGVFGGALTLASVLDKRSTIPFAPRDYPFDSLRTELNGSKGVGPRD